MNGQDIYLQIANGVLQLINGDGGDNRVASMQAGDDGNVIVVTLDDSDVAFANDILEEVKCAVKDWRINPFDKIDIDSHERIRFFLLPEKEIVRLYNSLCI